MITNSETYNFLYPMVEDVLSDFDIDSRYKIDEATRRVMNDEELNDEITNLIEGFVSNLYSGN